MSNPTIVGDGQAFDTASYVLKMARNNINDIIDSTAGDVLTDDWDGSYVVLNQAYRICQEYLANNGVETNVTEINLNSLSPVVGTDGAIQVWISQTGYFDGANNHENPALPADLLIPLRLWERFQDTQNPFMQVSPVSDGLPTGLLPAPSFGYWDWRSDAIYLPGATQNNQLRLRYVKYFPELTGPGSIVSFRRMAVALSYMAAYCWASPRNAANAGALLSMANDALDQIVAQTVRKKQRRTTQKRPYGGNGGGFRGWGF